MERPPRRIPVLAVAVGVIVVATVVGLVVLWPPAVVDDRPAPAPLLPATITSVEPLPEDDMGGAQATVGFEVTGGDLAGRTEVVDTQLEGMPDLSVGDEVLVARAGEADETLYIADFQRSSPLAWLVALFVGVVLLVGRWHGVRSLLGLGLSLLLVTRFIVPGILAGQPPALVALVGAVAVMLTTLYLTHGVSPRTTAAVIGTTIALGITVALGVVFVDWAAISGFASEEARFARVVVEGLDVAGLVLAGLIIAALGVLDDVTVAQAATVWALHDTDPRQGPWDLFRSAMSVGRDHIASTVNTLFLAYAGASLTLLVLFSTSGRQIAEIATSELVATELVKTLVGSLGLVAAVPITTALAAVLASRRDDLEVERSRRDRGHRGELPGTGPDAAATTRTQPPAASSGTSELGPST
nr:YibE/F family protein [Salsipaludibacter albus]